MAHLLYVGGRVWAAMGAVFLVLSLLTARGPMLATVAMLTVVAFILPGLGLSAIGSHLKRKATPRSA